MAGRSTRTRGGFLKSVLLKRGINVPMAFEDFLENGAGVVLASHVGGQSTEHENANAANLARQGSLTAPLKALKMACACSDDLVPVFVALEGLRFAPEAPNFASLGGR